MVIYRYLDPYTYNIQLFVILNMIKIGEWNKMGRIVKMCPFSYIGYETVID